MKKSAIKEMLRGNRTMHSINLSEEGVRLNDIATKAFNALKESLSAQQAALQEAFLEKEDNAVFEEIEHNYMEGFKLGLLIGIECMEE